MPIVIKKKDPNTKLCFYLTGKMLLIFNYTPIKSRKNEYDYTF